MGVRKVERHRLDVEETKCVESAGWIEGGVKE